MDEYLERCTRRVKLKHQFLRRSKLRMSRGEDEVIKTIIVFLGCTWQL